MKDSAALSATIWVGALQAAATVLARHRFCWSPVNPDSDARQILGLAACIIKHLPKYDSRMQVVVTDTIDDSR